MNYACINFYYFAQDVYEDEWRRFIMALAFILISFRSLMILRIFEKFRVLIDLIFKVMDELKYFATIMFLIIFIMAIGNNVLMIS